MSGASEQGRQPGRYMPTLRSRLFYQTGMVVMLLPFTVQAAMFVWFCSTFGHGCPSPLHVGLVTLTAGCAIAAAHLRTRRELGRVRREAMRISFEEGPGEAVDRVILTLYGTPRRLLAAEIPLALAMLAPLTVLVLDVDARLVEPLVALPACLLIMLVPPHIQRELWEIHRIVQFMPQVSRPSILKGHMSTRYLQGGILVLVPMFVALVEVYNASHVLLLAQSGTQLNIIKQLDLLPLFLGLMVLAGLIAVGWRTGQHAGLMLERISLTFEDAFRPRDRVGEVELPEMQTSFIREVAQLQVTAREFSARLQEIRATQKQIIGGLETAQRVKTVFLANMSHDLKSPLNSVIGFSELLLRGIEGELSKGQREDIQLIHASGEELLNLINNILDSARLEAGKLDLHPEWTPSVELVSSVVKTGMQQIGTKRIEFESEIQPGLPPVYVDPHRISQAIGNLISNAIKFMERGKVTVRAYVHRTPGTPRQRFLRIDVADTGAGIREEDRDRIFEAFQQIDRSYSRKTSGMGLGLTLTKRLVDLHDGKLMLSSEVGKGSTFSISLPIEE
jgi:signal transduction histidine kinase